MTTRDKKTTWKISNVGAQRDRKVRVMTVYDRDDRFVFTGKIRGLVDDNDKTIK